MILLLVGALHVSANSVAQTRVSLKMENVLVEEVFDRLEGMTGYTFLYNLDLLKGCGRVDVDARDEDFERLLEGMLRPLGLSFQIDDRVVVITRARVAEERKEWEVRGRVVMEDSTAVPGVTVLLKGTSVGVTTNEKGEFRLVVPEMEGAVLVFSFVGLETVERKVTGPEDGLVVVMEETTEALAEVVKTGYYSTTKRRASGSIAVVTKESLESKIPATIDNLLQGMVAGVAVTNVGRPGASSKIKIRGTNSIDGSTDPLWVVDGVPLQDDLPEIDAEEIKSGNFNEIFMNGVAGINPADIDNITILKDAAASAIYGSRAAGGVIVITTKQGQSGRTRVNYSARFGVGLRPQRDNDLMNTEEKLAWEEELWQEFGAEKLASGSPQVPVVGIVGMLNMDRLGKNGVMWTDTEDFEPMTQAEKEAYLADLRTHSTDRFDEIFQNSFSMSHHVSFSGGSPTATYYASLGYSTEEGLLKQDKFDRYTVNAKVNFSPTQKVKWGVSLSASNLVSKGPATTVDPYTYAYFANPYERPYNEDGSLRADMTYFNLNRINEGEDYYDTQLPPQGFNILRELEETESNSRKFSATGQATLTWNITSWLQFSGLLSYTFTNTRDETVLGKETYAAWTDRLYFDDDTENQYASISEAIANGESYDVRGQLSYSDMFGDHHYLNVLVGAELRGSDSKRSYMKRYGYNPNSGLSITPEDPDEDFDYRGLLDGSMGTTKSESKYASFYASMEYAYLERYILNGSFRTDGSNNFGSKEQFNPTWSLGLAWNMDEEPFMQGLKPTLSRLTLRASTGFTGNVVQGTLKELVVEFDEYDNWNGMQMGDVGTAPNPRLRWEKTRDLKVALEFGLFDDRVTGLVEGYWRKSMDVITRTMMVSTTGFSGQAHNSSEIENKGVEGTLGVRVVDGRDFKFNVNANVAWNRNVLSKYMSTTGAINEGKYVGYPLEAIFAGKEIGIDPYYGIYMYQLRPDAVIEDAGDLNTIANYRYYLGTSIAPWTGGFYLNFSYRNWSLGIGGAYSFGAKVDSRISPQASYEDIGWANETPQTEYSDLYTNHLNVRKDRTDRWTPDRTEGVKYPRIIDAYGDVLNLDLYNVTSTSITLGSFLEDVSFLRIRDITLHYNLPKHWLDRWGISSLGFSLMASNFFTFTNYSGIDPETPGQTYPITRSVAFGINLGF